ncbi:MAG: hypothetical protein K2K39_02520 [Clostridia bacterium]|nr:hypothetical protein [Clostridia bacterium]
MNFLASGGFSQFTEVVKEYWQVFLILAIFLALGAVLLVLAVVFRRFKTAFVLLLLSALLALIGCVTCTVLVALKWDLPKIVDFLVKFVPTIIFVAIILWTTFWGTLRGLRKSLILLAHEIGAAVICIVLYAVLINLPAVDKFLLNFVNFFTGSNGLQKMLGVSAECSGLKQVFVEWLPSFVHGINADFGIMLGESKAYIYTLADLIYHVSFAILLYIVYLILYWFMYLIYFVFYPERRYKRKVAKKYSLNKVDRRYHRHPVGGGVVGVARGLTVGLLAMSFLGSALFIVAGRGDGKLDDYDFGDDNKNYYYTVFRSIESYGTHGIFKVLNAVSSAEQMPYYLFAADLVFSGELNDEEFGVSDNVVFREELSAYTGFARDTMALLMKYGGERIQPIINGEANDKSFDIILEIMQEEDFRTEFNALIGDFDAHTYVINFALSFVNSAIANLDDMSFSSSVSPDNRELLKILFTKGYLSDTIPDERLLKEGLADKEMQAALKNRPCINIAKLVDKSDVQTVFALVLDVLGQKTSTVNDTLDLVAKVLPEVKKLSLLNENRAEELDPVLGRLYCYAANRYLTEEGSEGVTYTSVYKEKIEWVSEINSLIDTADSALKLYSNVYETDIQPLDAVVNIFDKNGENYAENCAYYDTVCDNLTKSRVLGKALSTSYVYNLVKKALESTLNGIYIPEDITYDSTFDGDGKLVSAGETYNLLYGVRALGRDGELLPMLKTFDKDKDTERFLKGLSAVLKDEDENGLTLASYVTSSKLLRSVITALIVDMGGEYVYVPKIALEKDGDGNVVNMITQSEIGVLLDTFDELIEFVLPVINGDDDTKDAIAGFVQKDTFDNLLKGSAVFEGTVAKLLTDMLAEDGTVVIPAALKENYDGWVSEKTKKGELQRLLRALEIAGVDIAGVINDGFDADKVKDNVLALTSEELSEALNSQVLHYTVSKFLTDGTLDFGSFKLIVPEGAQRELSDDTIPSLVTKDELKLLLQFIDGLEINEDMDISKVLVHLVERKGLLKRSKILSASIVNTLVDSLGGGEGSLEMPEKLDIAATPEELKNLDSSNPWQEETVRLIDALDEILGISGNGEFTFDETAIGDSVTNLLNELNEPSRVNGELTKLDICYASEVIRYNITVNLDEALTGNIDKKFLYGAKSDGYYSRKELQALSVAMKIFEIDLNEIDGNALVDKLQTEIFRLNDPAEGYDGKSKLNVVYPSVIFSGVLSDELDKVILGDGVETRPMIDEGVLFAIKGGSSRYPEEEISALINSINVFGKTDFGEIGGLGFDDVKKHIDKLDEICSSRILRGVITEQIRENNDLKIDHPLAYEEDIKILKTNEIDSVVGLINDLGTEDLEKISFGEVEIGKIRSHMFLESGEPKSYLLISAVSKNLKNTEAIYLNRNLIDSYGCVAPSEVCAFVNAFVAIQGENSKIDEWNGIDGTGKLDYPAKDERVVALKSEIVRAKLTGQFASLNNAGNFVGKKNVTEFVDYRTGETCYSLSEGELNALFDALDIVNTGNSFNIPVSMSVSQLKGYYDLGQKNGEDYISVLFASDIIRYKICETVIQTVGEGTLATTEETAFDVKSKVTQVKNVLTLEQVKAVVENFR